MSADEDDLEYLKGSVFFDGDWYAERYPDVGAIGLSPAEHYARYGFKLGRDPSASVGIRDFLRSRGKRTTEDLSLRLTLRQARIGYGHSDLDQSNSDIDEVDGAINRGDWPLAIDIWREQLSRTGVDCSILPSTYETDLRIVVFTCLFGGYEAVKEPKHPDPRVRWILFTDDESLTSEHWEVVHLSESRSSIRRASRPPKMLPHVYLPPHDISIYVDSSLEVFAPDLVGFALLTLGESEAALYPHHARNCVYDEIALCRELGIESSEVCAWFEHFYEERGHARQAGLWENTLMVRRDTGSVRRMSEEWWRLYEQAGGERDQFAFSAAVADSGVSIRPIGLGKQVRSNPFVGFTKHERAPLSPRPRVFKFIAYAPASYEQNLGRTYNDFMARLGDDDVAVFVDHDAMLVGDDAEELIVALARRCVERDESFVATTNRIGAPYQRLALLENDHDLSKHAVLSHVLHERNHDLLRDVTQMPSSSGVLLMMSKKTWQKRRFADGFLGVDNAFHIDMRSSQGKVLLARGLYLYHFYRADGDLSHAKRLDRPEPVQVEPAQTVGEHTVRTFVFSEDESLTISDYLDLLSGEEWAVCLSSHSIHCLKDWYPRITSELAGADPNTLLYLNSNLLDPAAPSGNDHLEHRAFARDLQNVDGAAEVEVELDPARIRAFAISRTLLSRLDGSLPIRDVPQVAEGLGTEFVRSSDVYVQVLDGPAEKVPGDEREIERWLSERNRVAILTLGFWPQQAGMEMFIHNLAVRMTEVGDEVVLFTPKPDQDFEEIERNYIVRRYRSETELFDLIGKHHNSLPFDSILVQGAHNAASLALRAREKFGIPVVLRTHGEDIQTDEALGYGYRLVPKHADLIEHNIRAVDHNVVIGSHVEADIRSIDEAATISVINNGVNPSRFTVTKSSFLRDRLDIGLDTIILLTVGRNHPKKCFHYAVEVLAELRAAGSDVCLVHAGKPGKGVDLDELARKLGVQDYFFNLGAVDYFDMPRVYASSDIFIFPSKKETFGNVTLEAMSSGLPCVEFDYGATRDKIEHGRDGFIVQFGDVGSMSAIIRQLVDDGELRSRIGAAARRTVEQKFNWSVVAESYRRVLRGVARSRLGVSSRTGGSITEPAPQSSAGHATTKAQSRQTNPSVGKSLTTASIEQRPAKARNVIKRVGRRDFAKRRVDLATSAVLEIGALNSPTFRREECEIYYADWLSDEGLAAAYPEKQQTGVHVDYVIEGRDLSSTFNRTFDLVIANHVVEHIPDMIFWLQELAKITPPDGQIMMAVPDRRYTFDISRSETTVAEFLDHYVNSISNPTFAQVFGHKYYHQKVDSRDVWAGKEFDLTKRRFTPRRAYEQAIEMVGEFHSLHCSVFAANSFKGVFAEIESTGLLPWRLVELQDVQPPLNEFLVALQKDAALVDQLPAAGFSRA